VAEAPKNTGVMLLGKCVGGDTEMQSKLSRFPNLVHAPAQHGDGVRTHMKGILVDDIANSAKAAGLVDLIDKECAKHKCDAHELLDAISFARKHGAI
jgi:hypothetical protein